MRLALARLSASIMISCWNSQVFSGAVGVCRTKASQPRTDSSNRTKTSPLAKVCAVCGVIGTPSHPAMWAASSGWDSPAKNIRRLVTAPGRRVAAGWGAVTWSPWGAGGSEVVAGVGEVEAFVGERKVGDDRVGEGDRQRGPVEEAGIDDLGPGQGPVRAEFDAMHDGAPPAFGDADGGPDREGPQWNLRVQMVTQIAYEVGDQAEGGLDLLGADNEPGQYGAVGPAVHSARDAKCGRGVVAAGVEGQ